MAILSDQRTRRRRSERGADEGDSQAARIAAGAGEVVAQRGAINWLTNSTKVSRAAMEPVANPLTVAKNDWAAALSLQLPTALTDWSSSARRGGRKRQRGIDRAAASAVNDARVGSSTLEGDHQRVADEVSIDGSAA